MVRKKQVNNENGAVLNRDFPRRSRSLFIGKAELCKFYPNAKPEYIEMSLERYEQCERDEDESGLELFGKMLAAIIIDETIGKRGGVNEHH